MRIKYIWIVWCKYKIICDTPFGKRNLLKEASKTQFVHPHIFVVAKLYILLAIPCIHAKSYRTWTLKKNTMYTFRMKCQFYFQLFIYSSILSELFNVSFATILWSSICIHIDGTNQKDNFLLNNYIVEVFCTRKFLTVCFKTLRYIWLFVVNSRINLRIFTTDLKLSLYIYTVPPKKKLWAIQHVDKR